MDIVEKLLAEIDNSALREVRFTFSKNKQVVFPSTLIRRIFQFLSIAELFRSSLTVSKAFLVSSVERIRKYRRLDRISNEYEETLDFTKNPFCSESVLKYCFGERCYFPTVFQWNLCFPKLQAEKLFPLAITLFSRVLDHDDFRSDDGSVRLYLNQCNKIRLLNESLERLHCHRINPWNITDDFLRELSGTDGVLFNHPMYEITPLRAAVFWTCLAGKLELLKELLSKLSMKDKTTNNLLFHLAVAGGHLSVVKYVSSLEGFLDYSNVCTVAAYSGHVEILKYLSERFSESDIGIACFRNACCCGDLEIVEFMIDRKIIDVSEIAGYWGKGLRDTPEHLKILDLILGMEVPESKNSDFENPFMLPLHAWRGTGKLYLQLFRRSCYNGSIEIVKRLLEKGKKHLNVDEYQRYYFTRLTITRDKKKMEILKMLEEHEIFKGTSFDMFSAFCEEGNTFKAIEMMDRIELRKVVPVEFESFVMNEKKKEEDGPTLKEFTDSILDLGSLEVMKRFTTMFSKELTEISEIEREDENEFISAIKSMIYKENFEIFKYAMNEKTWKACLERKSIQKLGEYCCHMWGTPVKFLRYLVEEFGFDATQKDQDLLMNSAYDGNLEIMSYLITELGLEAKGKDMILTVFRDFVEDNFETALCMMKHVDERVNNFEELEVLLREDADDGYNNNHNNRHFSDSGEEEEEDKRFWKGKEYDRMKEVFRICGAVSRCDEKGRLNFEQERQDCHERKEFFQDLIVQAEDKIVVRFQNFDSHVVKFLL